MGIKLNLIVAILMLVASILTSTSMVLINFFPEQIDKYKVLSFIIILSSIISYFAVGVFWFIALSKIIKRNKE